jgi:hypothetical protein
MKGLYCWRRLCKKYASHHKLLTLPAMKRCVVLTSTPGTAPLTTATSLS